jgi:outer membrane protein assembly factor BamB
VPGQGPDRQGSNPLEDRLTVATVGSLTEAWTVQLDEGPAGDPVTSGRGVHVNDDRSVYALDRATGGELWQHSVAAPRRMGQPFVRGDEVLVGSALVGVAVPGDDGSTTAVLDAATGAVSAELPTAIRALRGSRALSVTGTWMRFGTIQPIWIWAVRVTVRDLDTGATVYGPATAFAGNGLDSVTQDVTLGPDAFYSALPIFGATPCPIGLVAYELAVVGPLCSGFTSASWAIAENGFAPVLSDDQATLYFAGTDPTTGVSTAKAVDAATGAVRWSGPLPAAATASPSVAGGKLYVPTAAGDLVVFEAAGCGPSTCPPSWTASTGTGRALVEQSAVAGGVVYTASEDGSVHAFDAAGCAAPPCTPLWSAATGSPITGAPAVSGGRLYVGTRDGRLVAYGLPGRRRV